MDTETVFKIIDMLGARISNYESNIANPDVMLVMSDVGAIKALKELRNYLQEYIESEVSKAEDQMNEGGY